MKNLLLCVVRNIYSLLLYLLLPFLFFRLYLRGFKTSINRNRWLERVGIFSIPQIQDCIWIHAVSVGEFIASLPIIKALQKKHPQLTITVTTTTATGSEQVKNKLGKTVVHVYLPYDTPFAINNFLKKVNPKVIIIMETELWPNLFHYCSKYKIPLFIVNARLSLKSFNGYKKINFVIKDLLNKTNKVMSQSAADGDRFIKLGLSKDKLTIIANTKYDLALNSEKVNLGHTIKKELNRLTLIAASTHNNEEQQILNVFKNLKEQIPNLFLILVPRHPERFDFVVELTAKQFIISRRSDHKISPNTEVLIVDTMGELEIFYHVADIAFVGGSLVPIGGHNVLEPASASIPIVTGPNLHNFIDISQKLVNAKAMIIANNIEELTATILVWLKDEQLRKKTGLNALNVVKENQGATNKVLEEIKEFI